MSLVLFPVILWWITVMLPVNDRHDWEIRESSCYEFERFMAWFDFCLQQQSWWKTFWAQINALIFVIISAIWRRVVFKLVNSCRSSRNCRLHCSGFSCNDKHTWDFPVRDMAWDGLFRIWAFPVTYSGYLHASQLWPLRQELPKVFRQPLAYVFKIITWHRWHMTAVRWCL